MEEIKETDKSNENVRVRIVEVDPKNQTIDESIGVPRFTRTGKISYAKTRVYTQRYRKEWENMNDFKDWLTSVPDQNTKAYCKFCERTLHAHRLSLLKHMCTLKHQRAAAHVQREQLNDSNKSNTSHEIDEIVEENDEYEECSYIVEDEIITEGEVEEMVEESEIQEESPPFKKMRSEKEKQSDPLEEAMAHVNSDYLSENESEVNLQNESSDPEQDTVYIKQDVTSDNDMDNEEAEKTEEDSKISSLPSICDTKTVTSNVDNSKKMFIITSNGKPLTIVKGSQFMLNSSNNDNYTIAKVMSGDPKIKFSSQPISSTPISKVTVTNNVNNSVTNMSTLLRKKSNIISTYVLDTSKGNPVSGMQVSLYKLQDGRWTFIEESMTNANGVCDDFAVRRNISSGRYKLHYDVEKYYNVRKIATIYPFIEIVFDIKNPNSTYHTPLYLSPFSYSTFKDTSR